MDKCDQIDKAFKNSINTETYSHKEPSLWGHISNFFKGIGDAAGNNALTVGEHGTAAGLGALNFKCGNLRDYIGYGESLGQWGPNNFYYGLGGTITKDGKHDW